MGMARPSIRSAAGLDWITVPSREKATTPSVMWRKRVPSLVRSFSTSSRVRLSCCAMSLNVPVSTPISSREATSILWEKSPSATRSAPSVSRSMGVVRVLDSRKDSSTEMIRPKISASTIRVMSSLFRAVALAPLSST